MLWGNVLGLFYSHWDMQLFQQHLNFPTELPWHFCRRSFEHMHVDLLLDYPFATPQFDYCSIQSGNQKVKVHQFCSNSFTDYLPGHLHLHTNFKVHLSISRNWWKYQDYVRSIYGTIWENWHLSNTEFSHPWTDHISPFI